MIIIGETFIKMKDERNNRCLQLLIFAKDRRFSWLQVFLARWKLPEHQTLEKTSGTRSWLASENHDRMKVVVVEGF